MSTRLFKTGPFLDLVLLDIETQTLKSCRNPVHKSHKSVLDDTDFICTYLHFYCQFWHWNKCLTNIDVLYAILNEKLVLKFSPFSNVLHLHTYLFTKYRGNRYLESHKEANTKHLIVKNKIMTKMTRGHLKSIT